MDSDDEQEQVIVEDDSAEEGMVHTVENQEGPAFRNIEKPEADFLDSQDAEDKAAPGVDDGSIDTGLWAEEHTTEDVDLEDLQRIVGEGSLNNDDRTSKHFVNAEALPSLQDKRQKGGGENWTPCLYCPTENVLAGELGSASAPNPVERPNESHLVVIFKYYIPSRTIANPSRNAIHTTDVEAFCTFAGKIIPSTDEQTSKRYTTRTSDIPATPTKCEWTTNLTPRNLGAPKPLSSNVQPANTHNSNGQHNPSVLCN